MEIFGISLFGWRLNSGAIPESIIELEYQLKVKLPTDFQELISRFDGGEGPLGSMNIRILGTTEVVSFNSDYSVFRRIPSYFAFATDGGDYCITYHRDSMMIHSFPLGALAEDEGKQLAGSLRELFQRVSIGQITDSDI